MVTAVVVYIGIGLVVGAITRFTKTETSSLAGMLGTGGAAGLVGGVVANIIFSDGIELDVFGLVGSAVLAIVAVLAVRAGDRQRAEEAPAEEPSPEGHTEADEPTD
jgi:nitrate/nitrite transporter NarK